MTTSLSLAIAATVGTLSGAHTAIWGMYKDAAHEGFTALRFMRSMFVGAIAAVILQAMFKLDLPQPGALVLLFGLAYGAERGIIEVWKTFIRDEDQSKYFIPMQFTVYGKPVKSRAARLGYGVLYVGAIALLLFMIWRIGVGTSGMSRTLRAAIAGLVVGGIVAVSGGWKDAPKEGFDLLKFFRSPILTLIYSLILAQVTDNLLLIAVAAIGYERASAETYKTFFFPSKPRGKFAGKPVTHPAMLERRRYFVPAYVAISTAAVVFMIIAVRP